MTYSGKTDLSDIKWAFDIYKMMAEKEPIFLACDVTKSTLLAEARSYVMKEMKLEWFKGVTYIGAGAAHKLVAKSLTIAAVFLDKKGLNEGFSNSPEEARRWIEDQRRKLYPPAVG